MNRSGIWIAAGVAAAATIATTTPAHADMARPSPDDVAAVVAQASPYEFKPLSVHRAADGFIASLTDDTRIEMAYDPAAGLTVDQGQGRDLSVSLPGSQGLGDAVLAQGGSVTYRGTRQAPSVSVVPTPDRLQISTVIENAAQPERFDYRFGPRVTVEIQADGGAIAYEAMATTNPQTGTSSAVDRVVARVAAPWARDSAGVPVPTHYEARGNVLTQVVAHRGGATRYPVVADPTFDRPNIVQYRIRFSRAETKTIASGGAGVIASIGCGVMLPVCVLAGGTIWWNASVADRSKPKRCVQITATMPYVVPGLVWWVDTYSGGPCR